MSKKGFFKANNLDEILKIKEDYGNKACILAGGTDLMVKVNRLEKEVPYFLYIGEAGLDYIKEKGDKIIIGSAATLQNLKKSNLLKEHLPMLIEAVKQMGSVAIRNVATLGGNICNASPAADTAVPLLAYGTNVKIQSSDQQREVNLKNFFKAPGETILRENEVVKEFIINKKKNNDWAYKKIGRREEETLSVTAIGIVINLEDKICKDVNVSLGALGPTPLIAKSVCKELQGKKLDNQLAKEAASKLDDDILPIDDQRGTEWYRKKVSKNLVESLLKKFA